MTDEDDEYGHKQMLRNVVRYTLAGFSLAFLCEEADTPVMVDEHDRAMHITAARTFRDAGVLTLDDGVWVELSDGSAFAMTITASRRPTINVEPRPRPRPERRPTAAALPPADDKQP